MSDKLDMTPNHWITIKEHIRSKWSKLSATEIDSVKENMDKLVPIIRKVYRIAQPHAEREYHDFRVSLRPLFQPEIISPKNQPNYGKRPSF